MAIVIIIWMALKLFDSEMGLRAALIDMKIGAVTLFGESFCEEAGIQSLRLVLWSFDGFHR